MTERLPTVGGDTDAWGPIENGFHLVSHAADGTMNDGVSFGTDPASAGTLRLPNTGWIAGRNSDNDADVDMVRVSNTDWMQLGVRTFMDDVSSGDFGDQTNQLGLRRRSKDAANSLINTLGVHLRAVGTTNVGQRANGIRVVAEDDAAVVNKTITNMTRVGTTVTVTANGHGFATGDKIAVYGVVHTFNAEVNGSWTVANALTNTFDIVVAGLSSGSYTNSGTATNRPMMYGIVVNVNPTVNRTGLTGTALNADDVAALVIYNGGTGFGTDAAYIGRNSGSFAGSPEWTNGWTNAAYVSGYSFGGPARIASGGAYFRASRGTYDAGAVPLELPKNLYITFADSNGANVTNFAKYDSTLSHVTFGSSVAFGTAPARSGTKPLRKCATCRSSWRT